MRLRMGNRLSRSPSSTRSFAISRDNNEKPTQDDNKTIGTFFSTNGSCLTVSKVSLDRKYVCRLMSEARARLANNIQRVEIVSCSLGLDYQDRFTTELISFLKNHAPYLENLKITGHMLLETNQQACQLLEAIHHNHKHSLQQLTICVGQSANVALGTALGKLVRQLYLKYLCVDGISFQKTEAFRTFAQGVAQSTSLHTLDLSNCRIDDESFRTLVQYIRESSAPVPLNTILLKNNVMTHTSWDDLAQMCDLVKPTLQALVLSGMPFLFSTSNESLGEFNALLEGIVQKSRIKDLYMAGTGMNQRMLGSLMALLTKTGDSPPLALEKLNVSYNEVSQENALRVVATYLPRLHPGLKTLYILGRDDGTDGCQSLFYDASQQDVQSFFLKALTESAYLTRLRVTPKSYKDNENNKCANERHVMFEASDADSEQLLTRTNKVNFEAQIQSIILRNRLEKNLKALDSNPVALTVWPQYIAKRSSSSSFLVYQVLQRHLVSMVTASMSS